MIKWLKIRNLALLKDVEVEFADGFNVITGETGVGKTIILKAIELIFGERANKSIIRTGETRCEISGFIDLSSLFEERIKILLENKDIQVEENGILLRRVITESSNRYFVNDVSVSNDFLKQIRNLLIDFHGATENQTILNPSTQLKLLDAYGNHRDLCIKCRELYDKVINEEEKLNGLMMSLPNKLESEYLRRFISEFEAVNILEGEEEKIIQDFKVSSNTKNITDIVAASKQLLYDREDSAYNILTEVNRNISQLEKFDEKTGGAFVNYVLQILNLVKDFTFDMEKYLSSTDVDEETIKKLENRLNIIQSLKRKYGPTLSEVFKNYQSAKEKINLLDNFEFEKIKLEQNIAKLWKDYNEVAFKLSEARKKTAEKFVKQTKDKLKKLGFKKSNMSLDFTTVQPTHIGTDLIEIFFTANVGEALAPLKNVASSGELSRIMLAIKTVLSDVDDTPILVFDEIDVNIGGETAKLVGEELFNIGKKHQAICISHLPQVAIYSVNHLVVTKEVIDDRTYSIAKKVTGNTRIKEIARMLGGGPAALVHAEELLKKI